MPVRVLLIDDDATIAFAVRETLLLDGFAVDVLDRGRPAIGMIEHRRPDVVILDVSLPDITGPALAHIVRERWPQLPIIFATGRDAETLKEFHGAPRMAIIRKPYEIADLEELVMTLRRPCATA